MLKNKSLLNYITAIGVTLLSLQPSYAEECRTDRSPKGIECIRDTCCLIVKEALENNETPEICWQEDREDTTLKACKPGIYLKNGQYVIVPPDSRITSNYGELNYFDWVKNQTQLEDIDDILAQILYIQEKVNHISSSEFTFFNGGDCDSFSFLAYKLHEKFLLNNPNFKGEQGKLITFGDHAVYIYIDEKGNYISLNQQYKETIGTREEGVNIRKAAKRFQYVDDNFENEPVFNLSINEDNLSNIIYSSVDRKTLEYDKKLTYIIINKKYKDYKDKTFEWFSKQEVTKGYKKVVFFFLESIDENNDPSYIKIYFQNNKVYIFIDRTKEEAKKDNIDRLPDGFGNYNYVDITFSDGESIIYKKGIQD